MDNNNNNNIKINIDETETDAERISSNQVIAQTMSDVVDTVAQQVKIQICEKK